MFVIIQSRIDAQKMSIMDLKMGMFGIKFCGWGKGLYGVYAWGKGLFGVYAWGKGLYGVYA